MLEHLTTINNRFLRDDYWAECSCGWQTEGTSKPLAEEQAAEHIRRTQSEYSALGGEA